MKIELRHPRLSDARRYLEILSDPEFIYFPAKPATVKEEQDFLRRTTLLRKKGLQYDFAIVADGMHVGGAGIKIKDKHPYISEIGYFVDRKFWNQGIATKTVRLLEDFIAEKLSIVRIEIIAAKKNAASCRVALKSGYKKEGTMKKYLRAGETYFDCCLFAKIVG